MTVERTTGKQQARLFDLTGRVAVITGGAGMLGLKYAEAIAEMGGVPVLVDLEAGRCEAAQRHVEEMYGGEALGIAADITDENAVRDMAARVMDRFGRADILINNAALTVKGGGASSDRYFAPFEEYPRELFDAALRVNLTGAFLVTRYIGQIMVSQKCGSIVNISSDVGSISPDHRIYEGVPFNTPIAYSMSKAAILAFTRYLATYWAKDGIRVNSLSPAGVFDGQDSEFVERLSNLIPLGRMAGKDEYKGAILFLCSDASSFMTGANLAVDGGRTCW